MIRLVCVDEVHILIHYSLSFRPDFVMLSSTLFQYLVIDNGAGSKTKIPVLFMTATCTHWIFDQLKTLTSLKFFPDLINIHWPGPVDMMNQHIMIAVVYSTRPCSQFIKTIDKTLKTDRRKCFIGYCNIKTLVNNISE